MKNKNRFKVIAKKLVAVFEWNEAYLEKAKKEFEQHTGGEKCQLYTPYKNDTLCYVTTSEIGAYRLMMKYRTDFNSVKYSKNLKSWTWCNGK